MNVSYSIVMIAVVCCVTILLRALPFLIFKNSKKTPEFVTYLGGVLPYAIMGMLVVYCLKNVKVFVAPYGMCELVSVLVVVAVHVWKRNTLLSIISGTLCYMVLIQNVI